MIMITKNFFITIGLFITWAAATSATPHTPKGTPKSPSETPGKHSRCFSFIQKEEDLQKSYFCRIASQRLDLFKSNNDTEKSIQEMRRKTLSTEENTFYTQEEKMINEFMEKVEKQYSKLNDDELEDHIADLKELLEKFACTMPGQEKDFLSLLVEKCSCNNQTKGSFISYKKEWEKNITIISPFTQAWQQHMSPKKSKTPKTFIRHFSTSSTRNFNYPMMHPYNPYVPQRSSTYDHYHYPMIPKVSHTSIQFPTRSYIQQTPHSSDKVSLETPSQTSVRKTTPKNAPWSKLFWKKIIFSLSLFVLTASNFIVFFLKQAPKKPKKKSKEKPAAEKKTDKK